MATAFTFPNAPAGCPFGPTGYEGPGVSFGTPSLDGTSDTIYFNPAIPPGGSAYFSLENAIPQQCPPINAPNILKQTDPAWANVTLGNSTQHYTIGGMGCFITSASMMINYYAAKQGSSSHGPESVEYIAQVEELL